jgi:hypothetical protein
MRAPTMAISECPTAGRPPRGWREHLDRSAEATRRRLGVLVEDPPPPPAPRAKRKRAGRPPSASTPRRRADDELLARLCRETAPHHCRAEIRRRYMAATGRPISVFRVSRFAIGVMGLPRNRPGEHAGGVGRALARRPRIIL